MLVTVPPRRNVDGTCARGWVERVRGIIGGKVTAAHRALRDAGRKFLGAGAVMGASFIQRARSYEEKRGMIPTFAARVASVRQRLRRMEQDFRRRYRVALERWRSGVRDVLFPHGTWGMMVFHATPVELPRAA